MGIEIIENVENEYISGNKYKASSTTNPTSYMDCWINAKIAKFSS